MIRTVLPKSNRRLRVEEFTDVVEMQAGSGFRRVLGVRRFGVWMSSRASLMRWLAAGERGGRLASVT